MSTKAKVFSISQPEKEITHPHHGASGQRQKLDRNGVEIGRELVFYHAGKGWLTRQQERELETV